jgi:ATP-dependent DNA helicase RecG
MNTDIFDTSIVYLKGVGPKRAEVLQSELQISSYRDLMYYFPYRYIDRSKMMPLSHVRPNAGYVQCLVTLIDFHEVKGKGKNRLVATVADGNSEIELIWFQGIKWILDKLRLNQRYVIFGKANKQNSTLSHPEIELYTDFLKQPYSEGLQPMYNSTDALKKIGLDSRGIAKLTKTLIETSIDKLSETLPAYITQALKLLPLDKALQIMHYPSKLEEVAMAERRCKFEEIFYFHLGLNKAKAVREKTVKGIPFLKVGKLFTDFYNDSLPFKLTESQKKVIKEIWEDCKSGRQLNRLLQGDVGSGKTVVALMSMLLANGNGYQACLMAPTEILAIQHFNTIVKLVKELPVTVALLTGATKAKHRKKISEELQDGTMQILIGTHALIEDNVQFHSLGLVVIDEQHRFGVAQRAALWGKSKQPPHMLVMTATPIPRTLALTMYGDLDVSVINEFPHGEKKIQTLHYTERKRLLMYGLVRNQIAQGRQVYFVFPLIYESEKLDIKALMEEYDAIATEFPLPEYKIGILHGGMSSADKDFEMSRFSQGKTHILVATTVIEVGVDVPNATVMVIENAERFGLSQLHQLRGRIGRGIYQSYCVLMTKNDIGNTALKRIQTMVETLDGFKISEVDMELRGPGDPQGTQQSGLLPFKIIQLATDYNIIQYAYKLTKEIIREDSSLSLGKNLLLKQTLQKIKPEHAFWVRIG